MALYSAPGKHFSSRINVPYARGGGLKDSTRSSQHVAPMERPGSDSQLPHRPAPRGTRSSLTGTSEYHCVSPGFSSASSYAGYSWLGPSSIPVPPIKTPTPRTADIAPIRSNVRSGTTVQLTCGGTELMLPCIQPGSHWPPSL